MVENVEGNILFGNYPVFCQQVNCRGVMGAGLAKQIRAVYPEVFQEYNELYKNHKAILGTSHYTYTHDGRVCVSMFAQDGFGRDKCYTNYGAFQACLAGIRTYLRFNGDKYDSIAFPHGIGCGLAGGEWMVVRNMIEEFAKTIKQKVFIVKYNG